MHKYWAFHCAMLQILSKTKINVDKTPTSCYTMIVDKTTTIFSKGGEKMSDINLTMLNEKIVKSGMKRKAIAEKMNLTYAGLANKLNGKRDFSATEIKDIAHAINLTGEDILAIFFTN